MIESQESGATPRGRAMVLAVVAAVALAGAGAFVVGGSSAMAVGGPEDWSPHPGKEVSCPPANETTPNETTPDETNDTATNDTDDSGYQLVVNYTGAWQGTIVTNDTNVPIEGTGSEAIDIEADEDERVAATVSKANVTDEPMNVTLLHNGRVIDNQNPAEPTVDNFDGTDDSSTVGSSSGFDNTSSDSTFDSTNDTSSVNETGTDDGWQTFGDENEASAFEDDTVAADDGVFDDGTANTSGDSLDSNDSDTTASETSANDTNDTTTTNDADASEECAPANTSEPTNDTTTTNTTNDTALAVGTDEEGQVVFADQNTTGTSVVVESATVPDGGFVVIHNMSLMQEGDVRGSIVGVSDPLDTQRSEDIEVNLAHKLEESQTLIAIVYRDTDDDGEFEYEGAGGTTDEPYLDDDGSAVEDDAYVRVPGAEDANASAFDEETTTASTQETSVFTDTATPTTTVTATDAATDTATATETPSTAMSGNAEESTETNAPGFGVGVAVVAMLGGTLLATRRF